MKKLLRRALGAGLGLLLLAGLAAAEPSPCAFGEATHDSVLGA